MEVKLKIERTFDVKYLAAEVRARYWEDAFNVSFTEHDSIEFTDRFQRPNYFQG